MPFPALQSKVERIKKASISLLTTFPKLPNGNPTHNRHPVTLEYLIAQLALIRRSPEKRNIIVSGAVDSNGQPNFLGVGSGLQPQVLGTTTPFIASVAKGYNIIGEPDNETIVIDSNESFPALPASSTSYLYIDSDGTLGYETALFADDVAPPDPQLPLAMLKMNGADTSTTFTDETGGVWTANGNAQIDTAIKKYGSGSGLFDGSGDYVTGPTGVVPAGLDSWEIETWIYPLATGDRIFCAGNGNAQMLIGFGTASGATGSANDKLYVALSSNGSSWNIVNQAANQVITTGSWYHIALTFSGTEYKFYIDGVLKFTVSSSTKVVIASNKLRIGGDASGSYHWNGHMDDFALYNYVKHTAAFTPPTQELQYTERNQYWYDRHLAKMRNGNSSDGFTNAYRVYIGEADTDASSVTAVRAYAMKGRFASGEKTYSNAADFSVNSRMGTKNYTARITAVCKETEGNYNVGENVEKISNNTGATGNPIGIKKTATVSEFRVGTNLQVSTENASTLTTMTTTKWRLKMDGERNY